MRKSVIVLALVMLAGALGGAVQAADGPGAAQAADGAGAVRAADGPMSPLTVGPAADSLAPWLHPPVPMTWSCQQIPNLPAPTKMVCGTTSSPAFCSGKVIYNAVCGVGAGGYCLYCWQGSGPPDDFGNYPCDCRN